MGYTHYWSLVNWKNKPKDKWEQFVAMAAKAMLDSGIPLADFTGAEGTTPTVSVEEVELNGVGPNSHESFHIIFANDNASDFCKTARKPYDKVVTAVLLLAKHYMPDNITLGSDGDVLDWEEGRLLAEQCCGEKVEVVFND